MGMSRQQRAVALLAKKGRALGSKELIALSLAAAGNPFEKVIGMIEDLITRLKEAASAEAEHKAWCDEQLHANKNKRNKKTARGQAHCRDPGHGGKHRRHGCDHS